MKLASFRTCLLAIAALPLAVPAQAADAPRFSWGKAGVDYETYLNEAYDCAMAGLGSDISDSAPVEALRAADRQLAALEARNPSIGNAADPVAAGSAYANDMESIRSAARPDRQVEAIKRLVFPAIQQCMIDRGYTRFALTETQRAEMGALGKDEGRVFLHKLASDAAVLEQQAQPLAG